jgi:hypothetical protein
MRYKNPVYQCIVNKALEEVYVTFTSREVSRKRRGEWQGRGVIARVWL